MPHVEFQQKMSPAPDSPGPDFQSCCADWSQQGRLAGTPLVEDYDAKGLRTPQPRIVNDGMRWADGLQSLTVDPYIIRKSMLPQGHLHWLIYKVSRKDERSMWSLCQNLSRPSGPVVINQTITKLQMTAAKNLSIAITSDHSDCYICSPIIFQCRHHKPSSNPPDPAPLNQTAAGALGCSHHQGHRGVRGPPCPWGCPTPTWGFLNNQHGFH